MPMTSFARLSETARCADWWSHKIPPLLAIAAAGWLLSGATPSNWTAALSALAALVCVAVFGYVLNDLCDIDADRLGGRRNRMAALGHRARAGALLLPVACLAAIVWQAADMPLALLLGLNLLLPIAYSVPPLRLKGRGLWGALFDAAGVHLLPALIVARAATLSIDAPGPFIGAVGCWAALAGVRGIVLHQVADHQADSVAGVRTLVGTIGIGAARQLVSWLLPVELLALCVLLAPLVARAPLAALLLAACALLEAVKRLRGWRQPVFEPADSSREPYVPFLNNEMVEVWLPLSLLIGLAMLEPRAWLMVLGFVGLFHASLRRALRQAARACRARWPSTAPAAPPPLRVLIGATSWTVNGVNVFSANLARGLIAGGAEATILLTENDSELVSTSERLLPAAPDLPFASLGLHRTASWGAHWGAMVRTLDANAPCIYIPNSDWRHSNVCPRLSDRVIVVGIVHSDDPLHYDHVRRLGASWNIVVAVSEAVARHTLALCPHLADRLVVIPIGVPIPERQPAPARAAPVLRLIYHGILKQHQKRVLDLPRIVAAAAARGVPLKLTIVGAGPDEQALRLAAAPLVAQGLIHFHGLVAPEAVAALLEQHDVYLLASEFEGMPNALIEAMGRGCVPLVSRMESGIPELIDDGVNGVLATIGDAESFADGIARLWAAPALRQQMAANAFASVRHGGFRVEDMVASYRHVFKRAAEDLAAGRFKRPAGLLDHPPASVAGVSLFPVALPFTLPQVGNFPSIDDAEQYQEQLSQAVTPTTALGLDELARSLAGMRVFIAAPVWTANGVNAWSEDVARALQGAGLKVSLLFTEETTVLVNIDADRLTRPTDIDCIELAVAGEDNWGARWGAMISLLESNAPCVYFPTFDWRHSCISAALSDQVLVIGSFHDTGPLYLEHGARMGASWNGAIATDRVVARQVREQLPALAPRLAMIPHGQLGATAAPKERATLLLLAPPESDPAALAWLVELARAMLQCAPTLTLLVLNSAPAQAAVLAIDGIDIAGAINRQQMRALFGQTLMVVAADSTGANYRSLCEAMAHGAVPLVHPQLAAQWPALARAGAVVAGSADAAVAALARLRADGAAHAGQMAGFAVDSGYSDRQMLHALLELLHRARLDGESYAFRRRRGPVSAPPARIDGIDILPLDLAYHSRLGRFASAAEAGSFAANARLRSIPRSTPA
ncbi:glycosyltransferase [Massilia sp. DWR3-1-1]|uniref:glycosyltransferase n=1 Tax=Massilia sp. DWR3-1-1 TaxID=2804559 RepID=UPI003CEBACA3